MTGRPECCAAAIETRDGWEMRCTCGYISRPDLMRVQAELFARWHQTAPQPTGPSE